MSPTYIKAPMANRKNVDTIQKMTAGIDSTPYFKCYGFPNKNFTQFHVQITDVTNFFSIVLHVLQFDRQLFREEIKVRFHDRLR